MPRRRKNKQPAIDSPRSRRDAHQGDPRGRVREAAARVGRRLATCVGRRSPRPRRGIGGRLPARGGRRGAEKTTRAAPCGRGRFARYFERACATRAPRGGRHARLEADERAAFDLATPAAVAPLYTYARANSGRHGARVGSRPPCGTVPLGQLDLDAVGCDAAPITVLIADEAAPLFRRASRRLATPRRSRRRPEAPSPPRRPVKARLNDAGERALAATSRRFYGVLAARLEQRRSWRRMARRPSCFDVRAFGVQNIMTAACAGCSTPTRRWTSPYTAERVRGCFDTAHPAQYHRDDADASAAFATVGNARRSWWPGVAGGRYLFFVCRQRRRASSTPRRSLRRALASSGGPALEQVVLYRLEDPGRLDAARRAPRTGDASRCCDERSSVAHAPLRTYFRLVKHRDTAKRVGATSTSARGTPCFTALLELRREGTTHGSTPKTCGLPISASDDGS